MGGVKDKKKIMLIAVMLVGTFVAILNQTLLSAAIPKIMIDFNIDTNIAQWLTTIFMLTNAIMIPITAYLINRFTTRQLYIASLQLVLLLQLLHQTLQCCLLPEYFKLQEQVY